AAIDALTSPAALAMLARGLAAFASATDQAQATAKRTSTVRPATSKTRSARGPSPRVCVRGARGSPSVELRPTVPWRARSPSVDPCWSPALFPAFASFSGLSRSGMDQILEFFRRLQDVKGLIAWGGYVGLTAIIFAETGLLIGFFLPGDSLLVTA